jgi:hypothetical protein
MSSRPRIVGRPEEIKRQVRLHAIGENNIFSACVFQIFRQYEYDLVIAGNNGGDLERQTEVFSCPQEKIYQIVKCPNIEMNAVSFR